MSLVFPALDQSNRPRVVGGYRLDQRIGSGAMGTVYRAFDLKLGRDVALKLVSAEDESSEVFLRFVQEGAAAARIRHSNVVQVYNAGSEGGYAFLAMQLLEGETLAESLSRRGRLPMTTAVDFILPICSALMTAHGVGVLHRDLKPANIFLADLGRGAPEPYLLDFGVSKLDGPLDPALTQNPRFLGTPFYIAPEQANGAAGSWRSDQYSLALCLYECLLGVRPFDQHKSSLMKLLRHVAEGGILAARQLDESIPVGLDAALARALSTDPSARFDSLREFGAALLPYASPSIRQIWQAAFLTASDETMTSVNAPIVDRPSFPQTRSGQVTIAQPGSGADALPDTVVQGRRPDQQSALSTEPGSKPFRGDPSSLSRRRPPSSSALREEVSTVPAGRRQAPEPQTPSSSKHFNSVGIVMPAPRSEPSRSPGTVLFIGLSALLTLVMTAWLIREEFSTPAEQSYTAEVTVTPPDAEITLDGTTLSRGSLSVVLPKNGERHELLITHPDYEPSKILFQDRPPAPQITLRLTRPSPVESRSGDLPNDIILGDPDGVSPDETGQAVDSSDGSRSDSPSVDDGHPIPRAAPELTEVRPAPASADSTASPSLFDGPTSSPEPGASPPAMAPTAALPAPKPSGQLQPEPPETSSKIHTGNLDPWAK